MNIFNKLILVLFIGCLLGNITCGQKAIKSEKSKQVETDTNENLYFSYDNITKRSDKCVMVSGDSEFNNNYFVRSCVDGVTVKEYSDLGYIQDVQYTSENSGWMILSFTIVKIVNKRLISANLGKINNYGFDKVFFTSDYRGWAIGSDGLIVFTEDGGNSWVKQSVPTEFDLTDIVFSSKEKGWIIAYNVTKQLYEKLLLKTIDSGNTWVKVKQQPNKEFEKIFFLDEQYGWALVSDGSIESTKDGGETWKQEFRERLKFEDIVFVDILNGWAINEENLFRTFDGGKTWECQYKLPLVKNDFFLRVIFLDKINGWLWSNGRILQTKDSGFTWKLVDITDKLSRKPIK